MALNLEGFRKEVARALYEDIARATGVAPSWFQLDKAAQHSFEKMAGVCFDALFRKPMWELYEFFYGEKFDIDELAEKAEYVCLRSVREWSVNELNANIDPDTLGDWATEEGYLLPEHLDEDIMRDWAEKNGYACLNLKGKADGK